jgi:hypothetical protein
MRTCFFGIAWLLALRPFSDILQLDGRSRSVKRNRLRSKRPITSLFSRPAHRPRCVARKVRPRVPHAGWNARSSHAHAAPEGVCADRFRNVARNMPRLPSAAPAQARVSKTRPRQKIWLLYMTPRVCSYRLPLYPISQRIWNRRIWAKASIQRHRQSIFPYRNISRRGQPVANHCATMIITHTRWLDQIRRCPQSAPPTQPRFALLRTGAADPSRLA